MKMLLDRVFGAGVGSPGKTSLSRDAGTQTVPPAQAAAGSPQEYEPIKTWWLPRSLRGKCILEQEEEEEEEEEEGPDGHVYDGREEYDFVNDDDDDDNDDDVSAYKTSKHNRAGCSSEPMISPPTPELVGRRKSYSDSSGAATTVGEEHLPDPLVPLSHCPLHCPLPCSSLSPDDNGNGWENKQEKWQGEEQQQRQGEKQCDTAEQKTMQPKVPVSAGEAIADMRKALADDPDPAYAAYAEQLDDDMVLIEASVVLRTALWPRREQAREAYRMRAWEDHERAAWLRYTQVAEEYREQLLERKAALTCVPPAPASYRW